MSEIEKVRDELGDEKATKLRQLLYSPFKSDQMRREEEKANKEHFQRCSESWEGI